MSDARLALQRAIDTVFSIFLIQIDSEFQKKTIKKEITKCDGSHGTRVAGDALRRPPYEVPAF